VCVCVCVHARAKCVRICTNAYASRSTACTRGVGGSNAGECAYVVVWLRVYLFARVNVCTTPPVYSWKQQSERGLRLICAHKKVLRWAGLRKHVHSDLPLSNWVSTWQPRLSQMSSTFQYIQPKHYNTHNLDFLARCLLHSRQISSTFQYIQPKHYNTHNRDILARCLLHSRQTSKTFQYTQPRHWNTYNRDILARCLLHSRQTSSAFQYTQPRHYNTYHLDILVTYPLHSRQTLQYIQPRHSCKMSRTFSSDI